MSVPQTPDPCRLVISVLTARKDIADRALPRLIGALGPLEEEIGPLSFHFTSYYDAEMGKGLQRWLWVFNELMQRDRLAHIKCLTNRIEQAYTTDGKRAFNLDPGFMALENFILATGKNRSHRIYLEEGIFADLTLVYRNGTYRPLDWTFPDYADSELRDILNELRESYKCQLKANQK